MCGLNKQDKPDFVITYKSIYLKHILALPVTSLLMVDQFIEIFHFFPELIHRLFGERHYGEPDQFILWP